MAATTWTRAQGRPRRTLYVSSPIGLGHARRDLAIAQHLTLLHPGLQVDWLAQPPVTRVLQDAGQRVHPASAWLASESAHIEAESGEHDLHVFQAIREMDEILVNNFMVFNDVIEATPYDLVIGDEAWEIDYFLHENPELKRFSFAWITDFVGWLPIPDLGEREALLTADYNAEMLEQRKRYPRVRDRQVFVGNPADVVDESFGPGLPNIREWTVENYEFPGYVTGFEPPSAEEIAGSRRELGYGDDDILCIVAVGGSGVGEPLLRRVLDAVPFAREHVPELRFLVVTGPRIDPTALPNVEGATIRGYIPDLHLRIAAADVAVVQGGLTTTMELTAAGVPFLYVPLRHHFEQSVHVYHRLQNYRAGRRVDYDDVVDPEWLADAIVEEIGTRAGYSPVEPDGAERVAVMLGELL